MPSSALALHDECVVRFFLLDQLAGVFCQGVHGVCGDYLALKIDVVEQGGELGDPVVFAVHVPLADNDILLVHQCAEEVYPLSLCVPCFPQ